MTSPVRLGALVGLVLLAGGACQPRLELGSDVLWMATHEDGDFSEWRAPDGDAQAFPEGNLIEVSDERAHGGQRAAKLTLVAATMQANATLWRNQVPPTGAYFSAWYYVPRTLEVRGFWVIFKFRGRFNLADPGSDVELFDLEARSLPSGELALSVYDHRGGVELPLVAPDAVIPVGRWFQIEAFFRGSLQEGDSGGRLTYWLDGRLLADLNGRATTPTPWVQWMPCSIAENVQPLPAVLFIDDAVISRSRVGPNGRAAAP